MTTFRTLGHALGTLAALGAATPAPAVAQSDDAALAKRRDDKLDADFLKAADWITDYDRARARAKETGKPIFAYFTRSYAP